MKMRKYLPTHFFFETSKHPEPQTKNAIRKYMEILKTSAPTKVTPFLQYSSLSLAPAQQFWKVILTSDLDLPWPWTVAHNLILPGSRCLNPTAAIYFMPGNWLERERWMPFRGGCPRRHEGKQLMVEAEDGDSYLWSSCGSHFGTIRRRERRWVQSRYYVRNRDRERCMGGRMDRAENDGAPTFLSLVGPSSSDYFGFMEDPLYCTWHSEWTSVSHCQNDPTHQNVRRKLRSFPSFRVSPWPRFFL